MLAWEPFSTPMPLPWHSQLWLLLPLCLGIAIIYKTLRTANLARLWREILSLWLYMLAGLAALGVALWLISDHL